MTSIDGVGFDEAWNRKTGVTIDNLEIHVLSETDLINNKLATGWKQDELDVLPCETRNYSRIDLPLARLKILHQSGRRIAMGKG